MSLADELEKYLLDEISIYTDNNSISKNEDLINKGILDSLGIMKLIEHLEKTFDITVLDEEIVPDNFQTLENLETFVQQKLNDK